MCPFLGSFHVFNRILHLQESQSLADDIYALPRASIFSKSSFQIPTASLCLK